MGLKCHKNTFSFEEFCQIVPKSEKIANFLLFCVQKYFFFADSQKKLHSRATTQLQTLEALYYTNMLENMDNYHKSID